MEAGLISVLFILAILNLFFNWLDPGRRAGQQGQKGYEDHDTPYETAEGFYAAYEAAVRQWDDYGLDPYQRYRERKKFEQGIRYGTRLTVAFMLVVLVVYLVLSHIPYGVEEVVAGTGIQD